MAAADEALQVLRDEVSRLTLRLKELGEENRVLRDICNENGIQYKDRLDTRRHSRYFARLCAEHPIETTVTASDILGADPTVRGIAECAGSVLCASLICRDFFTAFMQLTVSFSWKFGARMSATLGGHLEGVNALAVLEGGRLASGSDDGTVKIWEQATGACVATLEEHEICVWSLAVLDGGRLASGSEDGTIKVWELATGACVATLEGHEDWVWSLAALEGGKLASGSDDQKINIWDSAF